MNLTIEEQRTRMLDNGLANAPRGGSGEHEYDHLPVVKIFCPWGGATWLLSELDRQDPDIAFGLCDLGLGFP